MFNNWKIGKRLAVAFGISILLMAVVAMAGFWGLSQTVQTTYAILHHDAKLMEQASQAQANGLELRRYEKDTFLNIGDDQKESDYSDKWNKEHADLVENLNALDQTVTLPEDKEILRVLRADLSTYTIGFQSVKQQISDKTVKSAPAANAAMVPFKDDIRRMDTALEEYANKNVERMNQREGCSRFRDPHAWHDVDRRDRRNHPRFGDDRCGNPEHRSADPEGGRHRREARRGAVGL